MQISETDSVLRRDLMCAVGLGTLVRWPRRSGTTSGDSAETGPAASSPFLTVDFSSPMTYPRGGRGQQSISQRMWGASTGGAGNASFAVFANATYTSLMAQVNPGLWYFNGNLPQRPDTRWFNGDSTVNQPAWANLINNFHKVDPLGVSGIVIGLNWSDVVGVADPASYGNCLGNLARYLSSCTMANGRRLPLVGFVGSDEPDGHYEASVVASYYKAAIPRIKSVSSDLVICGPGTSSAGHFLPQFMSDTHVDVCTWNMYPFGSSRAADPGRQLWSSTTNYASRAADDINRIARNMPYLPRAAMIGGYNADWDCRAASQHNYVGAMWSARVLVQSINGSPVPFWACIWDAFGDGTCGFVRDPEQGYGPMALTPFAYLHAQGVRTIHGPRWNVPNNSSGLLTCAVTPATGRCSVMIVNQGQGHQRGTVALSQWPVNASGNGTVHVWQMTESARVGQDGNRGTVRVTAGVTEAMQFPDPSVTIIST